MADSAVPEMVERVARAMCSAAMIDPDYREVQDGLPEWRRKAALARVAIAAMREPSKPMVDRAWALITSNLRYEEAYKYLVDAALSPEGTGDG